MPAHAEILKSKSKTNPFRVRYIGENGELVASSETLTTRLNCKKNIMAVLDLTVGNLYFRKMLVRDFTDKKFHPFRAFYLAYDGLEENIE